MKHPESPHIQQYFYKPASSQSKVDRVRVVQRNNESVESKDCWRCKFFDGIYYEKLGSGQGYQKKIWHATLQMK